MKIKGGMVIIETAEEAGCIIDSDPKETLEEWHYVFSNQYRDREDEITLAQLREAITPTFGDAVIFWSSSHPDADDPTYMVVKEWMPGPFVLKANAITIGKTVGELRQLMKLAKS